MGNPNKETIEFNKKRTFGDDVVTFFACILIAAFIGVFAYGFYKLITG